MAKTLGEQLQQVQNAIDVLEGGSVSSYEIDNRKLTYLDLQTLYKREEWIIKQIEKYGSNYIPGTNTKAIPRRKSVEFTW